MLLHRYEEMTPEKRPQDPRRDGTGLRFDTAEHGGACPDTMPQAVVVTDAAGRSAVYVPYGRELLPHNRPQDPDGNGAGLTFETLEHGGESADDMPQAVRVTDQDGRSCVYKPMAVNGRVVDSKGFTLTAAGKP